jgi:parallel beta helix pectate lyase-like protein
MQRRRCLAAAATAAAAFSLLFSATALGSPAAAPYDGGAAGGAQAALQVLQTGLFGLTVDLSSIGVAPSALATVGPQAGTSPSGNMLIVDDDMQNCPNAQFTRIQDAVNAAPPGAMIKVCAGTYIEQVQIPAGKDGLTLFSVPDLAAVIKAPLVMTSPKAIVRISGAQNVTLRHFTISGPGGGLCDSLEYGVRVDGGGSALITDNHITQIHDTPFSGCQNGVGVLIGRNFENTAGTGTVVHNTIDNYQKGGVVVDGPPPPSGGGLFAPSSAPSSSGSQTEVGFNEIDGIGPTAVIAQNGIQVSRGAIADVHHNVVKDNIYSLSDAADEAILLFEESSSQTSVDHNDVYHNSDGIGLYTTTNTDIAHNNSHDNAPYDGLFADTASGNNTIEYNHLFGNAEFDCDDISGGPYNAPAFVANPWVMDLGSTENRPGLCKHASP